MPTRLIGLQGPFSMRPNTNKGTVVNLDRDYLRPDEVERLRLAAKKLGRHGFRNQLMIRLAFIHGYRPAELVDLQWSHVGFSNSTLHVHRLKGSVDSVHPLSGIEMRQLGQLQRMRLHSVFCFPSERGGTMTVRGFRQMVQRAAVSAGFEFVVKPKALRHACGYYLANQGIDTRAIQLYLGHKNIQNTVRYTALNAQRFEGFMNQVPLGA